MTVRTNIPGADNYVLQEAIGMYADEAYTTAKKLSGTGIVGGNPLIDTNTETYVGQLRWRKPLNPVINVASLTDATDGQTTSSAQDFLRYIKTARTHGSGTVNLKRLVTQDKELEKIGRDFSETRAQDEHNAILSILRGVAISEVLRGAGSAGGNTGLGGQTFDNDPSSARHGFYVDLGAQKAVADATATLQGAARAEGFIRAIGMAYKDYEPEYAYLICSPETVASLRSANLVDQDRVQDGNIMFNTIFQGKFRLLQTRASQGFSSAELTKINTGTGIDIIGTKTSFIVLPGSIAMEPLSIENDVAIERKEASYKGGGSEQIWYRWGYVQHPAGYDWNGVQDAFPSDADYMSVMEGSTQKTLVSVSSGTLASTVGVWQRKTTSVLSLGILPVFHN